MKKFNITIADRKYEIEMGPAVGNHQRVTVNGVDYEVDVEDLSPAPVVSAAPQISTPQVATPVQAAPQAASASGGGNEILAPMPGKILKIEKKKDDSVNRGDPIMVMEAMKMENKIIAPKSGVIASIDVAVGDQVTNHQLLAKLIA